MKNTKSERIRKKTATLNVITSLSIAFCLVLSPGFQPEEKGTLSLAISNIKSTGKIKVAVYREGDDFPNSKFMVSRESVEYSNGNCKIEFQSIPFGTYAIALYQDVNGNNKLDKGAFGIPSEPFAFSNNVRPKFGSPDFDKCKFDFGSVAESVKITIINSLFGGN